MVPELYLKCKSEKSETVSHSDMLNFLRPYGFYPTRLLCPWNSPGKITGVGSHSLLHGIFLTQGSNPGLPHYGQILHGLSHQGSPHLALGKGEKPPLPPRIVGEEIESSQGTPQHNSHSLVLIQCG